MFRVVKNYFGGAKLIETPKFVDDRGLFHKIYNFEEFKKLSLNFVPKEQFFSISNKNVLRGMHFQIKKYSQAKLVSCLSGKILDVIVDLRLNSESFNKVIALELDAKKPYALYIPIGFAHGFVTLEENSILQYLTSTVYNKDFDKGIHWKSIDFEWPKKKYIVSKRDSSHPYINDLKCEFF